MGSEYTILHQNAPETKRAAQYDAVGQKLYPTLVHAALQAMCWRTTASMFAITAIATGLRMKEVRARAKAIKLEASVA